jgi:transglutaminase-like putative cysteine protease
LRLAIRHTTRYGFSFPVVHGLLRLRLKPKSSHGQQVLDWAMTLDGARPEAECDDHNNNATTLVSVVPGTTAVTVTSIGRVDTADSAGVLGPHSGYLPLWNFLCQTDLTRPGAGLHALAARLEGKRTDTLDMLHSLSVGVLDAIAYEPGHTDVTTTAEEALAQGRGVCQDHAHVFIGAARLLGVPARYVSGYLMIDGQVEQEAGHGWAEAHVDGLGWVGFDVSNGISPDSRYVRVATGNDYRDAAPVTGICVGAGETALEVSLAVEQQMIEQ